MSILDLLPSDAELAEMASQGPPPQQPQPPSPTPPPTPNPPERQEPKRLPSGLEFVSLPEDKEVDMRTVPIDSQEQILKEMEEGILLNSMQVVSATMEAAHIDPNEKEPPKEWVAAWGLEAARKRLRVAQQAWLPTREAPMFLKSAQNVAVGIIRSRAKEQSGPPELNVKKVALTISPKNYPEEMVVSDE